MSLPPDDGNYIKYDAYERVHIGYCGRILLQNSEKKALAGEGSWHPN